MLHLFGNTSRRIYFVMFTTTPYVFFSSNGGVLERNCDFRCRLEWAEPCSVIKLKTTHNFHGFSSTDGHNVATFL
jgi:hypothetical protein